MLSEEATTRTTDQPGRAVGVGTSRRTKPDNGSAALCEAATAASMPTTVPGWTGVSQRPCRSTAQRLEDSTAGGFPRCHDLRNAARCPRLLTRRHLLPGHVRS